MENVHNSTAPINNTTTPPTDSLPPDFLLDLRNKLLEVCALAGAVADEVGALPPDVIDEKIQALTKVMERHSLWRNHRAAPPVVSRQLTHYNDRVMF